MREILFKGKRIDNGEWVEGYLFKKYYQEVPHDRFAIQYKTTGDEHEWTPKYMAVEIEESTICQYTGLTDKNGNKIWENDIVKGLFYHGLEVKAVVSFKYGAFGLKWNRGDVEEFSAFTSICNVEYEIIGNIFDNPELLEGGAE